MDVQRNVIITTKRVSTTVENLQSSLTKGNTRLVQKHVSQLQDTLDKLLQACVDAEIERVSENETWMIEARRVERSGQVCLVQGEEYLLEISSTEENNAIQRVNEVKVNELMSNLKSFEESLKVSAHDVVCDVEKDKQVGVLNRILSQKKEQISDYQKQKVNIISEENTTDLKRSIEELDELFKSVSINFNSWTDEAAKHFVQVSKEVPTERFRNPELKVDRLSLPIFRGDVRHYARFVREFNNTVGHQFTDPKIKLMYLQNQCLAGQAKEYVRNLTSFDEAMDRLQERFGKVSVVLDTVLKEIKDLRLPDEEPKAVVSLSSVLERAWDDLKAIDSVEEFCNVVTLGVIEAKLPPRIQILWAQEKNAGNSKVVMLALREFLERQRKIAESVLTMRGKTVDFDKSGTRKVKYDVKNKLVGSVNVTEKKGCFRCGFNHRVKDCKVPVTIKCRRCHRTGHIENACREPPHKDDPKQNASKVTGKGNGEMDSTSSCNTQKEMVRLPIEQINTSYGPCTVLWDSGSMINLVSHEWAQKVGLEGKKCSLDFKVVDSSVKSISTKMYDLSLISKDGVSKTVKVYGIENLAARGKALDSQLLSDHLKTLNEYISPSDVDNCNRKVELLLGSSCIADFPVVKYKLKDMCLMSSEFGIRKYVVVGNDNSSNELPDVSTVCHAQFVKVTPLHNVCEDFVSFVENSKSDHFDDFASVEELGVRPPPICKSCKSCQTCKPASQFLSLKEYRELNIIKTKLSYDEQGKFWSASYPFLKDPSVLGDNYLSALRALQRRENKFLKNDHVKCLYNDQVEDFVSRGVISKMSESDIQNWNGPVRYVDHHEVFKEGSTTPLRIVINSSFRVGNELSFNDILMKGPNVLTSLLEILIRWRLYPVAFVGDVSKMYHNVKTGDLEGNLRRMLWRNCEQNRSPDVYRFNVVTFGDRPAGCIAVSALKATADMFSFVSEKASNVLKDDSYMDDVVSGANSTQEAKHLVSDIEGIASRGGFKFKKFQYSKPLVDVGSEEVVSPEKVLGVIWNPVEDSLSVRVDLNHNKRNRGLRNPPVELENIPFTRRICLRLVNGIFDPMGLFSPVTLRLKILMKQQFVIGTKYKKWDTLLDSEDRLEWIKVLKDILELNNIHIPRNCLNAPFPSTDVPGKYTLICFTDASKSGMCAAIYIRFQSYIGDVSVGLLISKTRVSPAKSETIPRLELCAALLGARLLGKVTMAISYSFKSQFFLIDSTIVLGSLNKGSLENDFTGNCVAEIRSKTESCTFAWVQSEDNLADLGSRGTSPEKVNENSVWQKGMPWMYDPVETWPIEIHPLDELPAVSVVQEPDPIININKFSDIGKLHKLTALCLKFALSKGNGKGQIGSWKNVRLTVEDYKRAEIFWIKEVSKSVVNLFKADKLQSLRPIAVWDGDGQFLKIVASGRLGKLLKIGYDTEELTILDPSHPYTELVLKECHEKEHGGDDRAVWRSRDKFWIPQARKIVKKIRSRCYRCKLLAKRSAGQLMAPLPNERVLPTPAWTFTSVDLFGPLEHVDMVRKRLKEKCWGIIFTCMVSRAVHIDLTQAYHTDAVLQSVRRFISLRGTPSQFLSDQGSQLIACSKEVSCMLELIDWSYIDGWCSKRCIEWKFVPPQGQHMNGVTESLVRSTKHLMKQTLEGKRLNFIETQTVLYEVAQVLNSRPLGIFSRPGADPLDGGPVTPNHLLLGRATNATPNLKFENVGIVKRMKFLSQIVEEFWIKWKTVVFHSLVPQYRWHKSQRNVKRGDVVLLNDDLSKIGEYRLGQVEKVNVCGRDGLVRSAQVRCVSRSEDRTTFSYLVRPVHKLCVIVPVEE